MMVFLLIAEPWNNFSNEQTLKRADAHGVEEAVGEVGDQRAEGQHGHINPALFIEQGRRQRDDENGKGQNG
jgi:hypothetical protein